MSEEEKFAINTLEFVNRWRTDEDKYTLKALEAIDTVLNLVEKQQNIINDMAEDIEEHMSEEVYNFLYICDKCKSNNEECHGDYCKETIIDHFTNKYEEGKG